MSDRAGLFSREVDELVTALFGFSRELVQELALKCPDSVHAQQLTMLDLSEKQWRQAHAD